MDENITHLFVYGTLRPESGGIMATRLENSAVRIGKGSTCGVLYNLGDYPGAIFLENGDQRIYGEVIRLDNPATAIPWMDQYEGFDSKNTDRNLFVRKAIPVETEAGMFLCNAYEFAGDLDGFPVITSGDYLDK